MARIRTLKPEFWADEKLALLPPITRLVFLGLISQADDAGRLVDNVKLLDGVLFPLTDDSCHEALEVLAKMVRIVRYRSDSGQALIQLVNWKKHQKIANPSKHNLPPPSGTLAQPSCDPNASLMRSSASDRLPSTIDPLPATSDQREQASKLPMDREAQITSVVIACNRGMGDNPHIRSAFDPILPSNGRSRQAVSDLLAEGIPVETICHVVYEGAKAYKPSDTRSQVTSLNYFLGATREEHARRIAKASPLPSAPAVPVQIDPLVKLAADHPEEYADAVAELERYHWWPGTPDWKRAEEIRSLIKERRSRPRIVA